MSAVFEKLKWYFFRLKAMNAIELLWRSNQWLIKKCELFKYCSKPQSICSLKYGNHYPINIDNLKLTINIKELSTNYKPELISGFLYENYKNDWSYGFSKNTYWPNIHSYKLNYKNRNDIGDVRNNWQLNRHHQFSILAKNYYLTKDKKIVDEFIYLFDDYSKNNPFLYGVSWTNPMEISIRCINWIFTYYFIYKTDKNNYILNNLKNGIENMSNYVYKHISKYSSANNHTVVELCCVLMTSILINNTKLIKKVTQLLTKELKKQNYQDGVNKEQSLHYEAFFLEAICLSAKCLKDNGYDIRNWNNIVKKMCTYIIDCLDEYGNAIEFGDNDEGYIIRLGKETDYYKYVINMACTIFNVPYSIEYSSETLAILLGKKNFIHNYNYKNFISYKDGGITLIRKNRVLIGIDHGPLGYNPLAAHGHADALSFQIIINNKKLFIDPGTFVYHINRIKRDYYRSTINHNTVCIDGENQSEIKGAFLWGKKANTELLSLNNANEVVSLIAKHDGYGKPIYRSFVFDNNVLTIFDEIGNRNGIANFSFGPECKINLMNNTVIISLNKKIYTMSFSENIVKVEEKVKYYSPQYGIEYPIPAIEITFNNKLITTINLKENIND